VSAPSAIAVRPARADDSLAIARMSRDLIEAGLPWRYTPGRVAALIADDETAAIVACDGGRVPGFALMTLGEENAHLVLLAVDPMARRRGVGRALIDWHVATARVAGLVSIGLELRADNDGALAFYRHLGFVETGFADGYYEGVVGARRMALALSGA
jgi:ribosomal-protein-alanine N-acetyltransferase